MVPSFAIVKKQVPILEGLLKMKESMIPVFAVHSQRTRKRIRTAARRNQNKLMFPPDCYKVGGLGSGKIRIFDVHVGSAPSRSD